MDVRAYRRVMGVRGCAGLSACRGGCVGVRLYRFVEGVHGCAGVSLCGGGEWVYGCIGVWRGCVGVRVYGCVEGVLVDVFMSIECAFKQLDFYACIYF